MGCSQNSVSDFSYIQYNWKYVKLFIIEIKIIVISQVKSVARYKLFLTLL